MMKRLLLCFILLGSCGIVLHAQVTRSTTGFVHSIYSDRRTKITWAEAVVVSLPASFSLIPGIAGTHATEYTSLTGMVGLAFNLPGQFYGQSAYGLEFYFEEAGNSVFHTLSAEMTYETATWFVSPSLDIKFSRNYLGLMVAPYFRFYPGGWGYFFVKYFGSIADDHNEFVVNNVLWTGFDLRIHEKFSLAIEGTAASVNEAGIDGEEYTGTAGFNFAIIEKLIMKYRFNYTAGQTNVDEYKIIKNSLVLDLEF